MKSLSDTTGDYLTYEEDEKLRDHCGVVGVYLSDHETNASRLAYYGLQSLQHRGQESTGIAVSDGEKVEHYKKMGLVADVCSQTSPAQGVHRHRARSYSTSGMQRSRTQPFVSLKTGTSR